MQEPAPITRVRCPAARCASIFEVHEQRLGRNMHCPVCGVRLTARPLAVERRLEARQRRTDGQAAPSEIARLPLAVLVDNVRSLWNVGSIFRTADACGVERIELAGITGSPPRPQITKTALGAEEVVSWGYRADPREALGQLTGDGYTPVAIETSVRAVSIEEVAWPDRVCLVVGNEVAGISPAVLEACAHHVSIPMLGVKNSLNVAVAFGIAAYRCASALSRRRPAGAALRGLS